MKELNLGLISLQMPLTRMEVKQYLKHVQGIAHIGIL